MRKGFCIHYSGILSEKCRRGVNYYELAGGEATGWASRLPCVERHNSPLVCDKREFPTEEQVKAYFAEFEAAITHVEVALKRINDQQGNSGKIDCPRCGSTIHWSRSHRNGHLHLRCSTPNCVSMMQ